MSVSVRFLMSIFVATLVGEASAWAQATGGWPPPANHIERKKAGSIEEITGTFTMLRDEGYRPKGELLELDLQGAIDIALKKNPQIRVAESGVEQNIARLDETESAFRNQYTLDSSFQERWRRITGASGFRIDPDQGLVRENTSKFENNELFTLAPSYTRQFKNGALVDISPSFTWENNSDAAFDNSPENPAGNNYEDRYGLDVRFDLPINSRPREQIRSQIENSKLGAIRSDLNFYLQKQRIIEQVINQYWNIKLTQEELDIQNERLLQARRIEFIIQTQYEFENASQVQVGQANIDVLNNEAGLIATEGNLQAARERFNLLLGTPVESQVMLTEELEISPLPMSASDYIKMVVDSNVEMKDFDLAIRQTENQLQVARLGQQTSLSWSNFFNRNDEGTQNLTSALIFSWPFGDGGATRARVRVLEESLEQQRINRWNLERTLVQETYDDLRSLQVQMQRIGILEKNVEQAYINLENDLFTFTETGRITFREMQDSQIDLAVSRSNLARAKVLYNAAKASLLQKVHDYTPTEEVEPLLGLLK